MPSFPVVAQTAHLMNRQQVIACGSSSRLALLHMIEPPTRDRLWAARWLVAAADVMRPAA